MRHAFVRVAMAIVLAMGIGRLLAAHELTGEVIDAVTGKVIPGAAVTTGDHAVSTDHYGRFRVDEAGNVLRVRAPGYSRKDVAVESLSGSPIEIRLAPFTPGAIYLSVYGIGNAKLRNAALELIARTPLNAVVIDVKGDHGMVAYPSAVPLATATGAQHVITIPDLRALAGMLHRRGIYAIARIVVCKDDLLATARPDLAMRRNDGGIYRDREGVHWVDPARREVRDYDIAIAVEAAAAGFDEIQFDYLRFPDDNNVQLPEADTQEARVNAIGAFLDAARAQLLRHNVFLAVDVFGYVCWNPKDMRIGQLLEDILPRVDYLSPMLYPSGFTSGIPDCTNPVAHPYKIVHDSLARVLERTHASPRRIRPWLQAFRDYAFDQRQFDADEIGEQIRAAEDAGTNGWMLWNSRNVYSDQGLTRKKWPQSPRSGSGEQDGPLRRRGETLRTASRWPAETSTVHAAANSLCQCTASMPSRAAPHGRGKPSGSTASVSSRWNTASNCAASDASK